MFCILPPEAALWPHFVVVSKQSWLWYYIKAVRTLIFHDLCGVLQASMSLTWWCDMQAGSASMHICQQSRFFKPSNASLRLASALESASCHADLLKCSLLLLATSSADFCSLGLAVLLHRAVQQDSWTCAAEFAKQTAIVSDQKLLLGAKFVPGIMTCQVFRYCTWNWSSSGSNTTQPHVGSAEHQTPSPDGLTHSQSGSKHTPVLAVLLLTCLVSHHSATTLEAMPSCHYGLQ